MLRRITLGAGLALAIMALPAFSQQTVPSQAGPLTLTPVVTDLVEPWAVGFLPDGTVLITEREGRLRAHRDGESWTVSGVPEVAVGGQGGLLDVMVPRDFAESREVFLSFSKPQPRGAGTALAVGRLSEDGRALENVRVIFEQRPGTSGGRHFGSRIVEAADGRLFLTIGDRGARDQAQALDTHQGKVIRINRDGSVPADNPFVDRTDVLPEIWSYGHRNAQGAALDLDGHLWTSAHGARGGDEVNRSVKGGNFGWPVISYGRHYSGLPIGEGTAAPGMEQPMHYWDPSIAPSGMMFYSGALVEQWRGDIFIGSLKFDYISRLDPENGFAEERISAPQTMRVRDVREGPDGAIWFLSVGEGALFRLAPP